MAAKKAKTYSRPYKKYSYVIRLPRLISEFLQEKITSHG